MSTTTSHLKELDLVRFFAFFSVFCFHSVNQVPPWFSVTLPGGYPLSDVIFATFRDTGRFGVDLFFTLSSFLITSLLLKEWKKFGRVQLGKFYLRRLLRIWPLYYCLALLVFGMAWLSHETAMRPFFWPNMLMAPNWGWIALGYPAPRSPAFGGILVFWSLGVEEQFYLGWGLALRLFQPKNIRRMAWGLILVALLTRVVCWCLYLPHPAIYANTLAHLDPIATGILLAWEWVTLDPAKAASSWKYRILGSPFALAAGVAGFLIAGWISFAHELDGTLFVFLGYPLVAWSGYLVVLYALLNVRAASLRGSWFRALAYLGQISYGLYLLHQFMLYLFVGWVAQVFHLGPANPGLAYGGKLAAAVLALAATVILGHFSYRYLESPFLKLKDRFTPLGAAKSEGAWKGALAPSVGAET